MTEKTVLITGSSSGFGRLIAQSLAQAGHTVYASMRDLKGKNAQTAQELLEWSVAQQYKLHTLELDVLDEQSIKNAVASITESNGHIDVLVNNAGSLAIGISECFTPLEVMHCFESNCFGHFRVMREVLPHMRQRRDGLVIHIGSVTSRIISPFQGPYVAAKSAWDALAQTMHFENTRYGVDSVIVQPGAYTSGTNHFGNALHPHDPQREASYSLIEDVPARLVEHLDGLVAPGTRMDVNEVAEQVRAIIAMPKGQRPFRVVVDPQHHGAAEINAVSDTMQNQFMKRMDILDLLHVTT
jgi:NAD(P)-dependent dehydrogenase (short-subunit alcohol dehydrogenase family)